jgi:heme oxygenase (biliverdin-IX-beta and delta-forming)
MISLHRLSPQSTYQPSVSSWCDEDFQLSEHRLLSDRINAAIAQNQMKLANTASDFMASKPFDQYSSLLVAQQHFHEQIRAIYDDPVMQTIIPGIASWKQRVFIRPDISTVRSIDVSHFHTGTLRALPSGLINRLGWLYIAHTTDIGSLPFAVGNSMQRLPQEPHPDPRRLALETYSERKRIIVNKINQLALSEVDNERIIAGARAAFGTLQRIVKDVFNPNCLSHWKGQ